MHPRPLNTSFQTCLPSPPTSPDGRSTPGTTHSLSTKRSHSLNDTPESSHKHPRLGLSPLESYLERGGSPNIHGTQNALSMLCWACHSRSAAALRVLLRHSELDPGLSHGSDCSTALHIAANIGFTQGVQLLLGHPKVLQDTLDKNGQTALHKAVASDHPSTLKLLLDNGARLDIQDRHGRLPLHLAVLHRNIACLSLLLNYQHRTANNPTQLNIVWTPSLNKRTPVEEAVVSGHSTILLRLFQDKAWRNGSRHKQCLVMAAIVWNRISCLDALIAGGCDINWASAHDPLDTPLYRAVQQRKLDMVQRLRQAGANPCNDMGENPSLVYAANHGFMDMAVLLLTPSTSSESISQALLMSESAGCRARLQCIINASDFKTKSL